MTAIHERLEDTLREALRAAGRAEADAPMRALPDKGLAHQHIVLAGTGLLLRCPKQSQLDLSAAQHLVYEAACFERAAASGHTPALHALLPPTATLPRGALLVDHVEGRAARLPQDLGAIAGALAALHAMPVPPPPARAPLRAPALPLAALLQEIEAQARHLAGARLDAGVHSAIESELQALRRAVTTSPAPDVALISFDAHPGNYVIRPDGRAILVDLEKARYGPPPLDLAHATLYTSTTWDLASHAVLALDDLIDFHERWLAQRPNAEATRRWIVPLRRAMWLWSLSWCAKWRVLSAQRPHTSGAGEDWSGELSDPALVAHVRGRVDHYLSPEVVALVREETRALQAALVGGPAQAGHGPGTRG